MTITIQGGEGAERFQLWRHAEGEPKHAVIIVAADIKPEDRRVTDDCLTTGARYVYFVTAHNAYGESGPSNELLVTP